jgi:hypothetical protein
MYQQHLDNLRRKAPPTSGLWFMNSLQNVLEKTPSRG